jgi:PilZ domain
MADHEPAGLSGTARRSERVYLRIPIEVQGEQATGVWFSELTHTLIINRHGARICLAHSVRPNASLTVTNLQTGVSCPFRAIGRVGKSLGNAPEWSVECLRPGIDFWGIYFPLRDGTRAQSENVDALLECTACSSRELAKLALSQYRDLSSRGFLRRRCRKCGSESEWRFGHIQTLDPHAPARHRGAPLASLPDEAKCEAQRLTVRLPVRIRLPDGRAEVTRTENLSKTGVCFVSDLEMEPGEFIRLTVGYVPGGKAEEAAARVVWRRPIDGTNHWVCGVHLEEET